MFHIFQKKKFLIDYLEGFVDIHNHILPGIDDGAKNVTDALSLIQEFSEIGVTKFIATPHIMHHYYPNTPKTIQQAYTKLQDHLLQNKLTRIAVEMAAEHMIDDNFEELLEQGLVMPLRKNYLLVEMSYLQASINFDSAIQRIASHRFFPILAHPERYIYLHTKLPTYKKFKEQGILFQLNLLSLSDFYGSETQKTAYKLLDEQLIDFVASDVHNSGQLKAIKELRISDKRLKSVLPLIEKTIQNFY